MRALKILIIPIVIFLTTGCKKDKELSNSVYISDAENPELPVYSEWGYNTFGAYYDRIPFISNNDAVPVKIIVTNDSTSFVFQGQKGPYDYYSNNAMSLIFKIKGFLPDSYNDLIILNDTLIDLKNPAIRVTVKMDASEYDATIISGHLEFKRAQNLIVDKKEVEVILSGHFEFQALINNEPIAISDGRFDLGIGPDNFFKY
jgi:hypothetical protein